MRVLIVDDDAALSRCLARALSLAEGFEVRAVASAQEALQVLAAWPPQVVVSDVEMPGLSGIELRALLAQSHPALPVVLMSGSRRLQASGLLLQKPFPAAELIRCCRELA